MDKAGDNSYLLRTLLDKDVHDRLAAFCQQYKTGLDKWDYGVGIQILLDFFEQNSTVGQFNARLDYMMQLLENMHHDKQSNQEQEDIEDSEIELLGGEKLK